MVQWITAPEKSASSSIYTGRNKFDSSVPIYLNVAAQRLGDGGIHILFQWFEMLPTKILARLLLEFVSCCTSYQRCDLYPGLVAIPRSSLLH